MIGEVIQEYLVGLGVEIDRPGFSQLNRTINDTTKTIQDATNSWTRNFVTAAGAVSTALTGISTATFGIMNSIAKEDMEMTKLAANMMVAKDAAWEMKKATDALGESVNDIITTPELLGRYKKLISDGRSIKIGGDFEETVKNFRDLTFEFIRLKQEVSYAMGWVGYYLMKYLNRPINEATEKFRRFNDSFVRNMSSWTEKAAKALIYIINIGKHFLEFISEVGKALKSMWDTFPEGVKVATAALAGLWLVMSMSPLGRMILLFSSLLLLIDDYFGYMEGKQAQFGDYWDKLNIYIKVAKSLWREFSKVAMPILEYVIELLGNAKDRLIKFVSESAPSLEEIISLFSKIKQSVLVFFEGVKEIFSRLSKNTSLMKLKNACLELVDALIELATNIFKVAEVGFKRFFSAIEDQDLLDRFLNSVTVLVKELTAIVEVISSFFEVISESEIFKKLVDLFADLLGIVIDLLPLIINFFAIGKIIKFLRFLTPLLTRFRGLGGLIRSAYDWIRRLFNSQTRGQAFQQFWQGVIVIMQRLRNVIRGSLKYVGQLGAALLLLLSGDFKGARKAIQDANSDGDEKKIKGRFSKKQGKGKHDPNFTEKQNEMWEAAQRAAERANKKYGFNLQPEWLYKQLAHESGANFDENTELSQHHNYGGLKGGKKAVGQDSRGHKYFANDDDFWDAYIDEFLGPRPELKDAKTLYDYARIMKETEYYRDTLENYYTDMKGIRVPNTSLEDVEETSTEKEKFTGKLDDYVTYKGAVSSEGLDPLSEKKFALLASDYEKRYGEKFYVTSARDSHSGWSSWHNTGQAIDIAMDSLYDKERRDWLKERSKYYNLVPLDEYENSSAHKTGDHFHFSDHGEPLDESVDYSVDIGEDSSPSIDDENYDYDYEDEYKNFSDEKFLSNQPVYVGGDFSKIETVLQNGFSQITESINAVGETVKNIFEKMSEVSFSIPTLNSNSAEKNVSSIINPLFKNISCTAENLFKEIPDVSSIFGKFPSSFLGDRSSTVKNLTEKFSDITPKIEEFFKQVDPAVANSIISGVSPTNEETNNNNNIRVEVGGVTVTVNGADKNPKEIGNEVTNNIKNIFNIADKINKAKNLTGTFLNI